MSYINNKWKNIAQGHTAFCILGGPSTKQVKNLQDIIQNNFTVTVNHNIKFYPNCDLYITADNGLAREYFEDKEFFLHKCIRTHSFSKNQWVGEYDENLIWIEGKRKLLLEHPNQTRVIICNDFPIYNHSLTVGQLYKGYGEQFCKEVPNTHLCIEHRDESGESYPVLSPYFPKELETYGTDPSNLTPGGNISGAIFQLLYYMGFDKVIVVGYGDKGESAGYEDSKYMTKSDNAIDLGNKLWTITEQELHAIVAHNMKWGNRLKTLHGGEILKEYAPYDQASYDELETTPDKKNKLVNKLLNLK